MDISLNEDCLNNGFIRNPSSSHIILFYFSFMSMGSCEFGMSLDICGDLGNSGSSSFCLGYSDLKSEILTLSQPLVNIALLTASGELPIRSDLSEDGSFAST